MADFSSDASGWFRFWTVVADFGFGTLVADFLHVFDGSGRFWILNASGRC